jgi:hypothetical protein
LSEKAEVASPSRARRAWEGGIYTLKTSLGKEAQAASVIPIDNPNLDDLFSDITPEGYGHYAYWTGTARRKKAA